MTETFTTQDLIAELQQHVQTAKPRRTNEKGETCGVTHQEWAEAQGFSDTTARRQLKKLVEQGKYEREWTISQDGIRSWVYYSHLK